LFERLSDHPFASAGIRPGGLELTRRGLDLARLAPGDAALDVGCGTGVTVEFLIRERSIRALGIDSSSVLVSLGMARNASVPIFLGDAEELPFAGESFDVVLLECALSLVRDRARALQECHRVLKPLGRMIVTDIYARNPAALPELRSLPIHSCLRGALDKNQFFDEWSAAGFANGLFEDHSEMLRDFAVQMIWSCGSLEPFWSGTAGCDADSGQRRCAVLQARPGYFLLVGSKAGRMSSRTEAANNESC
jgi:arsenite methyltransferase